MSGAMGTMMHQAGADLGGCISKWIVEHPELYRALAEDYFQVGCDIVAGATSNLNRISLSKFGLAKEVETLNHGVMRIIKAIQPKGGWAAGNVGPTGKILKPLGELDPEELREAFTDQVRALAAGGAEIINILTMYDLEEAVIALRAAKARTSLPVIVSLAFNPTAQGYRTMMGVSPEAAAERLEAEGADVIGANCGKISLEQMTEVIRLMRARCRKPLMAKPNAGSPQVAGDHEKYGAEPGDFARQAGEWVRAGAKIVSACCGSSPQHLMGIVKTVKESAKSW